MLVLSRKVQETVILTTRAGDRIAVTVVEIDRGKIRLGFTADESVKIMREELMPPNRQIESLRAAS